MKNSQCNNNFARDLLAYLPQFIYIFIFEIRTSSTTQEVQLQSEQLNKHTQK